MSQASREARTVLENSIAAASRDRTELATMPLQELIDIARYWGIEIPGVLLAQVLAEALES